MPKGFKPIGGGRFRNVRKGSPRQGRVFTKGAGGAHVYEIDGKRVRIGGKPKAAPKRPRPQPFDLTAPLTRQAFRAELRAAQGLQFGPQDRQIAAERRISDQQLVNTGSYYDDYLRMAEQAQQRGQAGYQQAAGNIRSATAAAGVQANAQNARLSEQANTAAAKLGAAANPEIDALALRAAQARQAAGNAQAGLVDALGATNNAYMADRTRVGAGAKMQALRDEQGNRRKVESAARDLAAEKGRFRVDFRRQAREGERRYALERSAFGLDQLKAQLSAQDAAADRRLDRAKLREDRMRDRRDFAADRDDEAFDRSDRLADNQRADRGGRGASSLTPSQRRGYQADFGQALSISRAYMKNGRLKKGVTANQIVDGIVAKKGYPRAIARAAVERAIHGHVAPTTAKRLRKFGVRVRVRRPKMQNRVGGVLGDVNAGAGKLA